MTVRKREYRDFEEFYDDRVAGSYELVTVVNNDKHNTVCADLMTECRNWQTAVRRFFKALKDDHRFDGWEESIVESIESGVWKSKETYTNPKTGKCEYQGGWFYEVEEYDWGFYICLNVYAQ